MRDLLIRNARLVAEDFPVQDLWIQAGRIKAIGHNLTPADAYIIEADGLVAAPGLVDMHVHLRDFGQSHKEDIGTGCDAAAAGGFSAVAAMPNTSPPVDTAEMIQNTLERASCARAWVLPVAAVTSGMLGQQLTDFSALKQAGAMAFSEDGQPVTNARLMLEAMEEADRLGCLLMSHCEDLSFAGGFVNEGDVSAALGVKGIKAAAEEVMTARDLALAASSGCRIHICHVSTANSVAMIREAKARGVRVTCETAPHYFTFDDSALLKWDADYRMSPPLRTATDVQAIIEGLKDKTIDAIATDHAPHTADEKSNFETAPNGVVGLETALAAGITQLVEPGHLSLCHLIDCMSTVPASLLGIEGGCLEEGGPADVVLFSPDESWTVDPKALHSRSGNTPFKGMSLKGRVRITIYKGRIVFNGSLC